MRFPILLLIVCFLFTACTHDPHADDYSREESHAEVIFSELHPADSTDKPVKSTRKGRLFSRAENDTAYTVIYLYNLAQKNQHTYTKLEFSLNLQKPSQVFPAKWSMYESKEDQPGEVVMEKPGQVRLMDSLVVLMRTKVQHVYKLEVRFAEDDAPGQNFHAYWNPEFGILIYDGGDYYSELDEFRDVSYVQTIEYLKDKVKNRFLSRP